MVRRYLVAVAVVLTLVLTTSPLWAVPGLINYQGKLTDSGGNPLDGTFSMTFRLYDASAGGAEIWSEAQSVMVTDGIYSVELGAVNPLDVSDFSSDTLYLEVAVGGEILSPPQRLTSTAFAMKARVAEGVADGAVDTVQIMDSAVTEEKVAESAITTGKIATNAITSEKIADGTVTAVDIVDGSGSGLDADKLDGQHASAFGDITGVTAGTGLTGGGSSGAVTLSLANPLSLSQGNWKYRTITGIHTDDNYGVYGENTAYGTSGHLGGTSYGVRGDDDSGNWGYLGGSNYGAYGGNNNGNWGYLGGSYGAYGRHNSGNLGYLGGSSYGAYGASSSGRGVYGRATATGDVENYGGYFYAAGERGRGVLGEASAGGDVENYGGYFSAAGERGRGVYGKASATGDILNVGGYFTSAGDDGRGVYGRATATGNVENIGAYFSSLGDRGRGVYGVASATGDVQNYGGYFKAIGYRGRGVYGEAQVAGSVQNYGGYFIAYGDWGRGVAASGGAYDFFAFGPGENYGSASSIRWKKNIQEIDNALAMVMNIRGVYFDWDEEHGGEHDMGFIAEEVGEHVPEIVIYEKDGVYASGIDYGAITPVLVQAIKEQQALIQNQQEQLDELKSVIEEMKKRQ